MVQLLGGGLDRPCRFEQYPVYGKKKLYTATTLADLNYGNEKSSTMIQSAI